MLPSPLQRSQVATLTNCPKMDCWMRRTSPVPPHWTQGTGGFPGSAPDPPQMMQDSQRESSTSFSTPKTASSKVSSTRRRRSAPRCGPRRAELPAPKKLSKRSPMSPKGNPSAPPGAPPGPV